MNNDLISREALKEDLIKFFPTDCLDGIESKTLFNQIVTDIDNAPTVDISKEVWNRSNELLNKRLSYLVRPHGEWKPIDAFVVKCSVCGVESFETPFCPRCGADMRGE